MTISMMRKCFLVSAAALVVACVLTLAVPVQQSWADNESITVSCYKGNSEEGNYVGEISVNYLHDAASDCNEEYEACQGVCLGCVIDAQYNQVCYDVNGEKVSQ
ncbi:MAG: hypothetical protein WCA04_09750 [Geobacteraceae bacterium]